MDKKEKLSDTWALADKPLLDKTKRTQRLSSDRNNKDSSDENSDQDSDSNDFLALPQEFRPNIKIHSQKQVRDTSISQIRKDQPTQNLASEKLTNNSLEKRTFHNSTNQDLSLQNKEENLFNNNSSVPTMGSENKIQYQIVKPDHFHQIAEGKKPDETSKMSSKVKKSLSLQNRVNDVDLVRQQRTFLLENEDKKKTLKYEHVQTNQLQTLHLNFNNLSFKDPYSICKEGLNYETRLEHNTYTNHKKSTQRENRITKQNIKKRESLSDRKFSVSSQQNIIRWDSSLKLDEDKIEWTVIHEKTSLMVKGKITSTELNNEFSSKECYTNQAIMNAHKKTFNNSVQNKGQNSHHTKPKAIKPVNTVNKKSSSSSNFEFSNNLLSNIGNNLDYNQTVINSDTTSDSDTCDSEQCIYFEHQSAGARNNVGNRLRENLSTSISVVDGSETTNHKKESTLTDDRNQNKSSMSHQATKNLKLPSHYGFQNLPWDATVESNISNHKNHEQPLSLRNKKQNGCSHLQEVENSLNMSACHNFIQRREMLNTKDIKVIKESILKYGKEVSNLIIASYTQLNAFISFYREWVIARKELIHHFEEVKQQLKESSTRFSRFKDILQIAGAGAAVAAAIPHPVTSVAAKVATVITSILQTFLNKGDKSNIDNSNEMTTAIIKDNLASSDLYIWGLQCSQQFEETTKLIEEFHSNADIQEFFDGENPELTTFIKGFLCYKPNHQIFYKKLHKCFQELLQSSNTNLSKAFCEPFTLYPLSVDVIGHLRWRYRHEDFDGSSVRYELEEIHRLIQNSNSISLTDLQKRIQTCIGILTDELKFMENTVKDISIFDDSLDYRSVK